MSTDKDTNSGGPTSKYIGQSIKGFLYLRSEILCSSNRNVPIAGMQDNLT